MIIDTSTIDGKCDFRIKPREPREFTILIGPDEVPVGAYMVGNPAFPAPSHLKPSDCKIIKVREVLE